MGPRLLEISDHGRVPFGTALGAHLFGQAFDLFGGDGDFGQNQQVLAGALEGGVIAAGVDDLLEQTRAATAQVNPQVLGLREKKPCGSGRKRRKVPASRPCRGESGRCVVGVRRVEEVGRNGGSVASAVGEVVRPGAAGPGGAVHC